MKELIERTWQKKKSEEEDLLLLLREGMQVECRFFDTLVGDWVNASPTGKAVFHQRTNDGSVEAEREVVSEATAAAVFGSEPSNGGTVPAARQSNFLFAKILNRCLLEMLQCTGGQCCASFEVVCGTNKEAKFSSKS
jgi:hypothetical protein